MITVYLSHQANYSISDQSQLFISRLQSTGNPLKYMRSLGFERSGDSGQVKEEVHQFLVA